MSTIPEVLPEEIEKQKKIEEKAREEAEARRLRILKSSNERIGLVEGTLPKISTNDVDENMSENAGGEDSVPATKTSSGSAARMAAMRRRRFKKANPTEDESLATTETQPTNDENATPTEIESTNISTSIAADQPIPDTVEKEVEMKTSEPIIEENISTKKYQGVAKMRRRMVKDRQNKNDDNTNNNNDDDETLTKLKERALKNISNKNKGLTIQSKFPIYMSIVTVILLFLAGLDVGLHQGQIDYGHQKELLQLHSDLAPRKLGVVLQEKFNKIMKRDGSNSKNKRDLLQDEFNTLQSSTDNLDEFDDNDIKKETNSKPANIDPLFGIDMDKVTEGSGIFYVVARFAVSCHRVNLAVLYYFPKNIINKLLDTLYQLIESPPLFCLVAIVIRQIIGKLILGAKLPTKVIDDNQSSKDVMSMGKAFVVNFIKSSFPTLVTMYDIFTHVRSDMYVVLCGFLVGVVAVHTVTDKLVINDIKEHGGTDEL